MAEPKYEDTYRIIAAVKGDTAVPIHRLKLGEATAKQATFRIASKQEVAVGYELLADAFVVIRELLDIIEKAPQTADRFGVIRDPQGMSS